MSNQTGQRTLTADFTQWPIVIGHMPAFYEGRGGDMLRVLDKALARAEPFVLVTDMEDYILDPYESAEEKKEAASWMQQNREQFFTNMRGTVYVLKDDAARETLLAGGRKQAEATGQSVQAAATLDEAIALARALISGPNQAGASKSP